ncbi:hypothetical protein [Massilia glaciei]|uniref:hypothetical protein n=1 Tax=Massilia glaciei TaxID=1524097 RepID=UPI0011B1FB9F|nr:hypothetical protein [Massilia glaciei]
MTRPTNFNDNAHPAGKAGDFDFLSGDWKIQHRQLKSSNPDVWDAFEGEATCWSILNGAASIEELRIPARDFSGMGLHLLNQEKQVWSDFWVNAKSGALLAPVVEGHFQDGQGVFVSEDLDGEQAMQVRGVWDNISPTTCRWQQATSLDGGKSWQPNWLMDWVRVA